METVTTIFEQRGQAFKQQYALLNRQYNTMATIRVTFFLLFLIGIIILANYKMAAGIGIGILFFPLLFGIIVNQHRKVAFRRRQAQLLENINHTELDIANNRWDNQPQGNSFKDKTHPFANDLDLFGKNSIFQLLNRCSTALGQACLATWLKSTANKATILKRQEAVKSLVADIEWRQNFQAAGLHDDIQQLQPNALLLWLKTTAHYNKLYSWLAYISPILLIAAIGAYFWTGLTVVVPLVLSIVNMLILKKFSAKMLQLTEEVGGHVKLLKAYQLLFMQLEEAQFKNGYLQELKGKLLHNGQSASAAIAGITKILDFLNARGNFFYAIIDVLLLFDVHLVLKTERWKKQNQADVNLWFEAVSEAEALNSIAGFAYINQQFSFPEISDTPFSIALNEVGHPLIDPKNRVCNDFALNGQGSLAIITGSNMSGKSTFLRTLGVNIVLAHVGAPICAKQGSLSIFQVFTSMRTEDNLEEHVSSFYAELQRIKALLDLVANNAPVFYMLDEILKGTNSDDRHIGAISLARQLQLTTSFGLISTHDLALGTLAKETEKVVNYSFNSEVKGNEILFPYTLDNGICKSFNASKLMEKIGIKIETSSR